MHSAETELHIEYIDKLRVLAKEKKSADDFLSQIQSKYCSPISFDFPKDPVKLKVKSHNEEKEEEIIEQEFYKRKEVGKFNPQISPISRLTILGTIDASKDFQDKLCVEIGIFLIEYSLSLLEKLEKKYDAINEEIGFFIENSTQCDMPEEEKAKLELLLSKQNSLESRFALFKKIREKNLGSEKTHQDFNILCEVLCKKNEESKKLLDKAELCLSERVLYLKGIQLIQEYKPPLPPLEPDMFFAPSSKSKIPLSYSAFLCLNEEKQTQLAILVAKQNVNILSLGEQQTMDILAQDAYWAKGKERIAKASVTITPAQFNLLDEEKQKRLAILLGKQAFQEIVDVNAIKNLIQIARLREQGQQASKSNFRPRF